MENALYHKYLFIIIYYFNLGIRIKLVKISSHAVIFFSQRFPVLAFASQRFPVLAFACQRFPVIAFASTSGKSLPNSAKTSCPCSHKFAVPLSNIWKFAYKISPHTMHFLVRHGLATVSRKHGSVAFQQSILNTA